MTPEFKVIRTADGGWDLTVPSLKFKFLSEALEEVERLGDDHGLTDYQVTVKGSAD